MINGFHIIREYTILPQTKNLQNIKLCNTLDLRVTGSQNSNYKTFDNQYGAMVEVRVPLLYIIDRSTRGIHS